MLYCLDLSTTPLTHGVGVTRGLTFHPTARSVCFKGVYFGVFISNDVGGEYVVVVGEFYEFYGIWWRWG